jgi:hypothetical protein
MRWLLGFVFAVGVCAQGLTTDQTELLALARTVGLAYSKSLPDFLCTEIVRRTEDVQGSNRWVGLDALAIKVSYASGREEYQLMQRNGHAARGGFETVGGVISAGEFGTRLLDIFAPESAAEFGWRGWGRVRRQRVAVFTYRVDRAHSRNRITEGRQEGNERSAIVGFHGEVSVDPDTGETLRVTLTADMPAGFPITACSSWTEYDYRDVAGRRYLLPVASVSKMERGRYHALNQIEFREYRKFQGEATITFK